MTTAYFYDTEFHEDGSTIDLISIGIVASDGREYYAVSSDFDYARARANDWLRENVLSQLPQRDGQLDHTHPDVKTKARIAAEVRDFLLAGDEPIELWAYYGAYDHVALAQLWGPMMNLPKGIPMWTHDLNQVGEQYGVAEWPPQQDGLHNALDDARWVAGCMGALQQSLMVAAQQMMAAQQHQQQDPTTTRLASGLIVPR